MAALSAAGLSMVPLRPMNSPRSAVHAVCRPPRSAKATRPPWCMLQGLRAKIAPVAASCSVTTVGADAPRDRPSTHSAKAVTDNRRGRSETLRMVSREILTGSDNGTYCSSSSLMPCATTSNRL
jgi:hypothetical protein